MEIPGKVLYPAKQNQGEYHEAHGKDIMVDGRVQRSLFSHLNECLPAPLTEQEKRLVSILEIVQMGRHVTRTVARYRYPGRKPLDRQALARAFVAKALYRHPTTIDLHRALQSASNLRRSCGFRGSDTLPSEATFSRAFAAFAAGSLGNVVHELVGHISRDSTAIVGREKPAKKVAKEPKPRRKRGRPAKGEQREAASLKRMEARCTRPQKRLLANYRLSVTVGTNRMQGVQNIMGRIQAVSGHQ